MSGFRRFMDRFTVNDERDNCGYRLTVRPRYVIRIRRRNYTASRKKEMLEEGEKWNEFVSFVGF